MYIYLLYCTCTVHIRILQLEFVDTCSEVQKKSKSLIPESFFQKLDESEWCHTFRKGIQPKE